MGIFKQKTTIDQTKSTERVTQNVAKTQESIQQIQRQMEEIRSGYKKPTKVDVLFKNTADVAER